MFQTEIAVFYSETKRHQARMA